MKRDASGVVEIAPSVLTDFDAILDARSPAEFAEDHLPGAISAPVLSDEERARVGTEYKQLSPFDAKKQGAALVSKNIARHLETLCADKPKSWRPLVYCWRGGKRSGAFAHILREIGWDAKTLHGGYKAYRQWAVQEIARQPQRLNFRVICGPTGSGKSRLLRTLNAIGAQVLDLEALAAHRGSVLGNLPGEPQPSQKMFESRVLHALMAFDATRPVFVEAESKKIGQLQVPDALIQRMRASECLRIEASIETRVALLTEEYPHFIADRASLDAQLDCLVALHGREKIEAWKAAGAAGDWPGLVRRLLEEHYDPAYRRSTDRNYTRLAQARAVPLPGPESENFARLARLLGVEPGENANVLHDTAA
jgi:tRNA 2-selenouridine synthase